SRPPRGPTTTVRCGRWRGASARRRSRLPAWKATRWIPGWSSRPSSQTASPQRTRARRARLAPFLDLGDLVREETVCLAVDRGPRVGVGRLEEAEHAPGGLVEPIAEVLHAVLVLDFQ